MSPEELKNLHVSGDNYSMRVSELMEFLQLKCRSLGDTNIVDKTRYAQMASEVDSVVQFYTEHQESKKFDLWTVLKGLECYPFSIRNKLCYEAVSSDPMFERQLKDYESEGFTEFEISKGQTFMGNPTWMLIPVGEENE